MLNQNDLKGKSKQTTAAANQSQKNMNLYTNLVYYFIFKCFALDGQIVFAEMIIKCKTVFLFNTSLRLK